MSSTKTSSLQRVLTTIGHKEPDRVPLFLLVTMHGAKELNMSISQYFSKAENVIKGQLRMWKKYQNDCLYNIFYAPIEIEAMGGEVIFRDDGPANSGRPVIESSEEIETLEMPEISEAECLQKVLKATAGLKAEVGDEAPIIGVVMSPFSLPVMQMGFDRYLDLLYDNRKLFNHLIKLNEKFCIEWANAQIDAGATAIGYFDPISSPTIIPRTLYLETGYKIAKRTLSKFKGPAAIHLASGRTLPIIDDIKDSGALIVGVSTLEDITELKEACRGKICILGNLNGIEMRTWTPQIAEARVKDLIARAGPGGGFILSDNHGEIPWQVPEKILLAISKAVHKWGRYPLDWVEDYER